MRASRQRFITWVVTLFVAGLGIKTYLQLLGNPAPVLFEGLRHWNLDSHRNGSNRLGAVTSESSLCSKVGIELLRSGGNAADAAVGTIFCIGVVVMYHSGIGGGGFMIVRRPNHTHQVVDFREKAPSAAYENMFYGNVEGSLRGGLASGVPGELRALEYLHNAYGRLPWKSLVQPSIDLARFGFLVTADLVVEMDKVAASMHDFLVEEPAWSMDFAPNGSRIGLGDTMKRTRYAATLEEIANKGADAFYKGGMAKSTVSALKLSNGTMTVSDLEDYSIEIREPLTITYRDFRLIGCGAPSSGPVALSAMKLFEGYSNIEIEDAMELSTHRVVEALRFGYGMRPYLGDPLFSSGIDEYQTEMTNETTAARNRVKVSDSHTLNISDYNPEGLETGRSSGTAQVVIADAEGLVISVTTTVNNPFGSKVMVPETGIIMNNHMNDFSIPHMSNGFGYLPAPANFIRPGKRPLSSMTPVIVEHLSNSTFYFAVGAAGGSRIITAVVQALWFVLDLGLTPVQALGRPRFHDQLVPNQMMFEYSYNNHTVESMRQKGHNTTWIPRYSRLQAVQQLSGGEFLASSDPNLVAGGGFTC